MRGIGRKRDLRKRGREGTRENGSLSPIWGMQRDRAGEREREREEAERGKACRGDEERQSGRESDRSGQRGREGVC